MLFIVNGYLYLYFYLHICITFTMKMPASCLNYKYINSIKTFHLLKKKTRQQTTRHFDRFRRQAIAFDKILSFLHSFFMVILYDNTWKEINFRFKCAVDSGRLHLNNPINVYNHRIVFMSNFKYTNEHAFISNEFFWILLFKPAIKLL